MEILRWGHDAWDQPLVNGVSWDMLWIALGVGAAVVVIHFIYRLISGKRE